MRKYLLLLAAMLFAVAAAPRAGRAGGPFPDVPPPCEPGCKMVAEVCYKEVVRKVCRTVPDVKKVTHWVYDCKGEDYCAPRILPPHLGSHHGCDDGCKDCGKPRCRCMLVKTPVVEECSTTKCIVEYVSERVPYVVYRKVRCGTCVGPYVGLGYGSPSLEPIAPPQAGPAPGHAVEKR